ncbi:hypothetical protein ZWY2020_025246 [Hordeum vulgare]|nr:hypothetical protein ZWY2020_025246 [Hordeum vulgare]
MPTPVRLRAEPPAVAPPFPSSAPCTLPCRAPKQPHPWNRAPEQQRCTRPPKTPGAELPPVWTATTPWRPRSMASLPCPIPLHSACPRRSRRCLFHPHAFADGRDAPPHADPSRSVPGPPLHSLAAPPRASLAAGRAPVEEKRPAPRRRRAARALPGDAVRRRRGEAWLVGAALLTARVRFGSPRERPGSGRC